MFCRYSCLIKMYCLFCIIWRWQYHPDDMLISSFKVHEKGVSRHHLKIIIEHYLKDFSWDPLWTNVKLSSQFQLAKWLFKVDIVNKTESNNQWHDIKHMIYSYQTPCAIHVCERISIWLNSKWRTFPNQNITFIENELFYWHFITVRNICVVQHWVKLKTFQDLTIAFGEKKSCKAPLKNHQLSHFQWHDRCFRDRKIHQFCEKKCPEQVQNVK